MAKTCAEHGPQEALVSSNAAWYRQVMSFPPVLKAPSVKKPVAQGCPFDCGACSAHEQRVQLPVLPITSACNLDCPICYTHNKNESAYHMSEAELRSTLDHMRSVAPDRSIVNITGGEPTMHPQFERIVELCHEAGIHRVTISTHGMRFLKDEWLLAKLAALDARVILSFDSFTQEGNVEMLGGKFLTSKMKVLDLLSKHGVNTTLLPVLAKGVNDKELGLFVEAALERDNVRSVEFHPMTFTGQSGTAFSRASRYDTFEVLTDLERLTAGKLRVSDFVPSPAAHSLCYLVTYLLQTGPAAWTPFPRFMGPQDLRQMLAGRLYLEPGPEMEVVLQDVINRLWVGEIPCEQPELMLTTLRNLAERIFEPGLSEPERLRVAERASKAIYVHTHMDEENFDTDRIRQCCVGMPGPDGSNVPSCAYNILYRERDERFMLQPKPPLTTLGPGRLRVLPSDG
jgi:hypothetical protein